MSVLLRSCVAPHKHKPSLACACRGVHPAACGRRQSFSPADHREGMYGAATVLGVSSRAGVWDSGKATGTVKKKVLPWLTTLSTQTDPLWASTISLTRARPRPVPPIWRGSWGSTPAKFLDKLGEGSRRVASPRACTHTTTSRPFPRAPPLTPPPRRG